MRNGSGGVKSFEPLESYIYPNEHNNSETYPVLDEEFIIYMNAKVSGDRSTIMCFTYYRNWNGRTYIDIYIWDAMQMDGYSRFVLEEGYALSRWDERKFRSYILDDIRMDDELFQDVVKKMNENYPEIHLVFYPDEVHTLLHIYYSWHRSGPYEILFKSNLNHIAVNLENMEDYNLVGCSPQEVLGVPIGMLRALNTPVGAQILETAGNRELASKIYAEYHNFIHGKTINMYQWKYLNTQFFSGKSVEHKMIDFLSEIESSDQYYEYMRYLEYKDVVDDYYAILPKFPDIEELDEYMEACDMIEWHIEHQKMIDSCLKDNISQYQEHYAYEAGEYLVTIPLSVSDLLSEAEQQHSCLYSYILKMAYYDTVILFMREKRNRSKSLVTLEVKDGMIYQALRKYNRLPDEKQNQFIAQYAEAKKLTILSDECEEAFDDDIWEEAN